MGLFDNCDPCLGKGCVGSFFHFVSCVRQHLVVSHRSNYFPKDGNLWEHLCFSIDQFELVIH